MKLKCVVVDDEPLAMEMMAAYVRKTPYLQLEKVFSNSLEALDFIRSNAVDLAFLDIQMPDLNGLELSRLLAGLSTRIVFVTAYEQYALQGFKVDALDYLLKPVSYVDFLRAAEKALRWFELTAQRVEGNDMGREGCIELKPEENLAEDKGAVYREEGRSDSIFVRADYRWVRIRLEDILFVESVRDYVKIHLDPQGKSRQDTPGAPFCVMTLQSMKSLEEWFPAESFMRVHRSFLVNMEQVSAVEKGRIVFSNGESVPVSDSYKPVVDAAIQKKTLS